MASNFRIFRHRIRDSLHLKLEGDFDGSSAHELLNALTDYGSDSYQIFINTNDLKSVDPFGRNVFQKNLYPAINQSNRIVFIGANNSKISIH